ncbi:hypothetical protein DSO57_1016703 [Entomophthora muscae]|uniref:Uncharacterized protein n=1 Tax=Entomophthora muscae TaxID=34485 RepID=A0ACC2S6K3_9FUNG|nr:hypothetical protein DSO57_1016703 [Entomophthora muscae]
MLHLAHFMAIFHILKDSKNSDSSSSGIPNGLMASDIYLAPMPCGTPLLHRYSILLKAIQGPLLVGVALHGAALFIEIPLSLKNTAQLTVYLIAFHCLAFLVEKPS